MLCFGCESSSGASVAPRPAASVKAHPAFSVPKTAEMLADSDSAAVPPQQPMPSKPGKSRDKKDWAQNCKIQRPCAPQAKELPTCDAQQTERPWIDVVTEGDAVVGKEVEVSGTLGLTLLKKSGPAECAAGACCHALDMQIVLVGEPTGSLPLRGLTCSGDDSILCCSVPTEGQSVLARGRLRRLSANQWQLDDPSLCVVDHTRRH